MKLVGESIVFKDWNNLIHESDLRNNFYFQWNGNNWSVLCQVIGKTTSI